SVLPAFAKAFRHQAEKAMSPALAEAHSGAGALQLDTDWTALSLVDNAEVERGVTADRLALSLTSECEGELEAVYAFMATLCPDAGPERNPIRPQAIARSLMNALAESDCEED